MDARLNAITEAVGEISRNLLLLQNGTEKQPHYQHIEDAMQTINNFQVKQMHEIRVDMEDQFNASR